MSTTEISGDSTGYTPVIDDLLIELGLMPALVFGKIWRYCQMKDKVCNASQQRIADELCLSLRTVNRATAILVKNGYLAKKRTKTVDVYSDTGKAKMTFSIIGQTTPQSTSVMKDANNLGGQTTQNMH